MARETRDEDDGSAPVRACQASTAAEGTPADELALGERTPARMVPRAEPEPGDRTVGTGSVFALGCTLAAVAVIVVGILVSVFLRAF